jgi:uncharacterized protein YkwD
MTILWINEESADMPPTFVSRGSSRFLPRLEELEDRRLLSGYWPTSLEQEFLERLNDARANPWAYGVSIGVDLSTVAPSPPLAYNVLLEQSARDHSQDMDNRNYFGHNTPEGIDPPTRIRATGFVWTSWGESIAGGYPTPETALAGLIADRGVPTLDHRRQLLAIDPLYRPQNQVGVGIVQGGPGYYGTYYTIDTASSPDTRPILTGVVYQDANHNGLYDAGEGLGNVTIGVNGIGSTATGPSGGYSLPVAPGTYTVTASGGGLTVPLTRTVTVGTGNYRLNFDTLTFRGDLVPVTTVNDGAGRPVLFALGLDNQVWVQKLDAAGNSASGYFLAATGQVKTLAMGHDGSGDPELFVIGLNDRVYAQKFDGDDNPVGGYGFTTEGAVKTLAVGHDAFGRPELFTTGLDDQVWAQKFDAWGNSASTYFLTSPGRALSLQVGQDASGLPEVFILGTDSQVYAQKFDAYGNPVTGYFLTAGGAVKSITVGHDAFNEPEIFALGMDDQVYAERFDGGGNPAGGYTLTTPGQVKAISVSYDAYNDPELFAIGLNDFVYTQRFNAWGGSASGYVAAAYGSVQSITAGRDAYGDPELFAIGADDQVWGQKFDGNGSSISGYWLTQPGLIK